MDAKARVFISYFIWPALMIGCTAITAFGMARDQGFLYFNIAYVGLALSLFLLERRLPHERAWLQNCGQMMADFGHTLVSKGTIQVLSVVGGAMGVAKYLEPEAGVFWPESWPLAFQVLLGLLLAEAGLYWAHRLAHV